MRQMHLLLILAIAITGCRSQQQVSPKQTQESQPQCASDDTPEVCKVVKQCFDSGTSPEVCRMGEKDAMQQRKDLGPAYGASAKPAPKPAPKEQKQ